uniref:BTB domain-containing protein n=1 Tax=Parastrongyloides trichosuri TaxID=131310 RepID=A0A0N4ZWW3_PARTI
MSSKTETSNKGNQEHNQKILIHSLDNEENVNYYSKGESFNKIENDDCPTQQIAFIRQFKFHKDDFKEVSKPAELLSPLEPMLTYHNFVAVYWKLSLMYSKANAFDAIVSFVGPSKKMQEIPKGALGPNVFEKQSAPSSIKGNIKIGSKSAEILNDHNEYQLTSMGTTVKVYVAANVIKKSDLDKIFEKSDFLFIDVKIIINKDYFNIEKFVGNALGSGSGEHEMTLATVLNGEKHGGSNCVFSVKKESGNEYDDFYVHMDILRQSSVTLANIFSGNNPIKTDQWEVLEGKRIIFPFLSKNDMKMILTYLYSGEAELPKYDSYAKIGRVLSLLVSKNQLLDIFKQWDQQMANFLLDMYRENNDERLVTATVKALIAIFSAPYGALPLSKRIAVALLASKINEFEVTKKNPFDSKELKDIISRCNIDKQLGSVMQFKHLVTSVKKEYVK